MQAVEYKATAHSPVDIRASSNTAGAAGAMIGAVAAGIFMPVVGAGIAAAGAGFVVGKALGWMVAQREKAAGEAEAWDEDATVRDREIEWMAD